MFLKQLIPSLAVIGSTLFGAVAHALEEVRKNGWKGWFMFGSDIFVCSFVGWLFFHAIALISTDVAIVGSSIGSYWGTKGFVKIRDWFFESIIKIKPSH